MGIKKELAKSLGDAVVSVEKRVKRKLTEFEKAHEVAQRNAALPVEQGGLGLPPDNTAMDRARAMGFDAGKIGLHGSGSDIKAYDLQKPRAFEGDFYGEGMSTTIIPSDAEHYASYGENPVIYPVMQRGKFKKINEYEIITPEKQKQLIDDGYSGVDVSNELGEFERKTFDINAIRSRFAAFDPMKRNSPNLLASAGAGIGAGVLYTPEENQAQAGWIEKGGRKVLEAYHGTPHTFAPTPDNPLGAFDLSKIGTGEGAQAYGHGIYLADNPAVAKEYRERLSDVTDVNAYELSGQRYDRGTPEFKALSLIKNEGAKKAKDLLKIYKEDLAKGEKYLDEDFVNRYEQTLLAAKGKKPKQVQGALYKVEFDASPDELLDWDKPLSEQSDFVKTALSKFISKKNIDPAEKADIERRISVMKNKIELNPALAETYGERIKKLEGELYPELSITGQQVISDLFQNQVDASKALKEAGIKGIQYADAGSRGKAGGTKNYVVFDDKTLKILERGQADPRLLAGLGLGTGAAIAANNAMQSPTTNDIVRAAQTNPAIGQVRQLDTIAAPQGVIRKGAGLAAEYLGAVNKAFEGSPAELVTPTSLEEWLRKYSYGQADMGDAAWAAFDVPMVVAPAKAIGLTDFLKKQ